MKYKLLLTFLTMTTLSPGVLSKAVEAFIKGGFDSNPFLHSEIFSPEEEFYVETEVNLTHRFESGFSLNAQLNQTLYNGDATDADRRKIFVDSDYRVKGKLFGIDVRYKANLSFTDQDRTYISRTKGVLGTINGVPVPDRYDAQVVEGGGGVEFRLSKQLYVGFSFDGRAKSYQDYTDIGVSNLDYDHLSFRGDIRYKPNKTHNFRAFYRFRQRTFDDRVGRDQRGNKVDGSELKYDYHMSQVTWNYKLSKAQDIQVYVYLENRSDNVSGYYDTSWQRANFRYRNEWSKKKKFETSITYKDYAYDINDTLLTVEGEEPINTKEGFELEVSYSHNLGKTAGFDWWFVTNASYEDYDSTDAAYVYDRKIIQVGLQANF